MSRASSLGLQRGVSLSAYVVAAAAGPLRTRRSEGLAPLGMPHHLPVVDTDPEANSGVTDDELTGMAGPALVARLVKYMGLAAPLCTQADLGGMSDLHRTEN